VITRTQRTFFILQEPRTYVSDHYIIRDNFRSVSLAGIRNYALVSNKYEAGWAQELAWTLYGKTCSLPLSGIDHKSSVVIAAV